MIGKKAPKAPLMRDPADWARDWGWVSRRRAVRAAARISAVAADMCLARSEGDVGTWSDELESVAKYLAPAVVPAERKRAGKGAVA